MKDFLNGAMSGAGNLREFINLMYDEEFTNGVALSCTDDPGDKCKQFFGFIGSQPRMMSERAKEWIEETDKLARTEGIAIEHGKLRNNLLVAIKAAGEALDNYTRSFAAKKYWSPIYNGPMPVIAVWRDKSDGMAGTPTERMIPSDDVPLGLMSMVTVEQDSGSAPMLATSGGRYDASGYRQDFLIDIAKMFERGMGKDARDPIPHRRNPRLAVTCLQEAISMAQELLSSIQDVAELMSEAEILDDHEDIFGIKSAKKIRREVKPEDNPNAKIDIGGWA